MRLYLFDIDGTLLLSGGAGSEALDQACFMVLKGGNLRGTWAQQFGYGEKGIGSRAGRLLVPGEEFRGTAQGHNNLYQMDCNQQCRRHQQHQKQ